MNRQRILHVLLWVLVALWIVLCAARYGYHHVYELSKYHTANDFGHQFLAARAVSEGLSPYRPEVLFKLQDLSGVRSINPFVYPPLVAILLLPFSHTTFRDAYFQWTVLNQLLLFASLGLLVWGLPRLRRPLNLAALAAVVAYSEPLWRSYSAGQLNTVLLILMVGALVCVAKGRAIPAAVLVAVAAHVKVTPLLLLLLFFWKRDWRALAAGVGALIGVFLVTLIWVPWNVQMEYLPLLRQMGYGSSTWAEYGLNFQVEPANQSISALLYRLMTTNPQTHALTNAPGVAKTLSLLGTIVLFAVVAWRLRWRPRTTGRDETLSAFLLLWWVVLPTPSLCWDHYLVQLVPHLALSFAWLLERRSRWGLVAWAVAAVLISRRVAFWDAAYREGWGIVWCASKLYGMLILGGVLLYLHPTDKTEDELDLEEIRESLEEAKRGETLSWEEVKAKAGL